MICKRCGSICPERPEGYCFHCLMALVEFDEANASLNKWCNTEGINYYEGIEALGNLFKYTMPKLIRERWDIIISYGQDYKTWDVELNRPAKQAILKQTPLLEDALFWAIWEAIKK